MATAATNVSVGKPSKSGGVWRAAYGTALPTDAKTALAADFKCLGYCNEDGLSNENSPESENIKAWGGDTVLTLQKSREDTFKFTLIEAKSVEAMKAVYGDANVSGTLSTGITVKANSNAQAQCSWVFEMILRDNSLKRIVVPSAAVTEVGEITYNDGDPIGYEITITATADGDGNTHYEYIQEATA